MKMSSLYYSYTLAFIFKSSVSNSCWRNPSSYPIDFAIFTFIFSMLQWFWGNMFSYLDKKIVNLISVIMKLHHLNIMFWKASTQWSGSTFSASASIFSIMLLTTVSVTFLLHLLQDQLELSRLGTLKFLQAGHKTLEKWVPSSVGSEHLENKKLVREGFKKKNSGNFH